MMFVVRSVRCNRPVRPNRSTVRVSSSSSRIDATAPGYSSSSKWGRRSRARFALASECRSYVLRSARSTLACIRSGR